MKKVTHQLRETVRSVTGETTPSISLQGYAHGADITPIKTKRQKKTKENKRMKMTEETLQKILRTPILNLNEADIKFVFHILNFDLKEFKQETGRVRFEVHNERTYIASIEVTVTGMVFSNEWINFGDGNEHGLSMPIPKCLGEIIVMFANVFTPQTFGWIDFNDMVRRNIFESENEARNYLDALIAIVVEIVKPYNETESETRSETESETESVTKSETKSETESETKN